MASSKKNKTAQDQAIAAKRVEFVKANPQLDPAEARKRFFVQTRAAELQAKGVEVTKQKRQELRQKFATGGVQRQGFYTPGDLQRIAAAKASGSKTNTGSNTNAGSIVSPSGSGQNFNDYKMLSKENTARRPVAPKAPKGFDEQSLNPMQFFKSPLAKGVAKLGKGAYNIAESTAESFNATFINPAVNLAGKAIGKNPNLRQAGPMEAAVNTADVILTIATAGASKGATVPLKGLLPAKQGIIKSTATKLASTIDDVMPGMNVSGKLASAGKNTVKAVDATKTTAAAKVGPKLKTAKPVKSSTPKLGVKTAKSSDGVPAFLKTADDMPATPKPAAAKAKPKATPKPKATVAKKNAARRAADADQMAAANNKMASSEPFDFGDEFGVVRFENFSPEDLASPKSTAKPDGVYLKYKNPAKPKDAVVTKPKSTPKPKASTAKPAAAPKTAKPKVNRFADAWDDSPIDMNKVDFSEFTMESSKPYSTARRATVKKADDVAPVSAPKPAAKKTPAKKTTPKTTAPKANAKAAFDKSVTPIKTGSQTKLTFKTQADYNQFLKTGGKERLRQMSPELRTSFERVNEKWIKGATEARQAAEAAQKNTAARALARKRRYDRARPALKAKFNEALIRKQERELLAKVTKKK